MSEDTGRHDTGTTDRGWRAVVITFFPMLIAVLSLLTSVYNGYLNNKFVTLIQGNLSRAEYMRTCRDAIDAYFQVKYRADVLAKQGRSAALPPGSTSSAEVEAGNAVARFGALATYLANLRDEETRARYTDLYGRLDKYVAMASGAGREERTKASNEADAIFAGLNDDCVKQAAKQP